MGDEDTGRVSLYSSRRRALFPIEGIHVSRSFARFLRTHPYRVSFDEDFAGVIRGCQRPGENWIVPDIARLFEQAFEGGIAHSCEVWEGGELVGGIYGLAVGGVFSAESMFHRRTSCSKLALHSLLEHCRKLGFQGFDAQVMNPHLRSLGAYEVSPMKFLALLRENPEPVAWRTNC